MSLFDIFQGATPTLTQVTAGRGASIGEAFGAAFQDQSLNWSAMGAFNTFEKEFGDKAVEYGAWGGDNILDFPMGRDLQEVLDHYTSGKPIENETTKKFIEHYDAVAPEGEKVADVVRSIRERAAEVEQRAQKTAERSRTAGAVVGGFAGNVAGSFTTNDPFNLVTLPVGGFGKSILTRIASEIGVNSGIEAVNQFGLVPGNRRALGLDEATFDEKMANVVFAGVGAGVLRGAGEATGALFRAYQRSASARALAQVAQFEEARAKLNVNASRPQRALNDAAIKVAVTNLDTPLFRGPDIATADLRSTTAVGRVQAEAAEQVAVQPFTDTITQLETRRVELERRLEAERTKIENITRKTQPAAEEPQPEGGTSRQAQPGTVAVSTQPQSVDELIVSERLTPEQKATVQQARQNIQRIETKLEETDAALQGVIDAPATLGPFRSVADREGAPVNSRRQVGRGTPEAAARIAPLAEAERVLNDTLELAEVYPERQSQTYDALIPDEEVTSIVIGDDLTVDLDEPIIFEEGAQPKTVRQLLAETRDDDDMLAAMKECLL